MKKEAEKHFDEVVARVSQIVLNKEYQSRFDYMHQIKGVLFIFTSGNGSYFNKIIDAAGRDYISSNAKEIMEYIRVILLDKSSSLNIINSILMKLCNSNKEVKNKIVTLLIANSNLN